MSHQLGDPVTSVSAAVLTTSTDISSRESFFMNTVATASVKDGILEMYPQKHGTYIVAIGYDKYGNKDPKGSFLREVTITEGQFCDLGVIELGKGDDNKSRKPL
ncbi:MAG: hypothetical protein HQL32_04455 [Planctomycetes bacterium]|nr:hypothetical protein [Planctomycetota bacterium]